MFADGRPCEILSIPVERCYSHIGEFEKFPRERKKTFEDSLLRGKHKCADFAEATAVEARPPSSHAEKKVDGRDALGKA